MFEVVAHNPRGNRLCSHDKEALCSGWRQRISLANRFEGPRKGCVWETRIAKLKPATGYLRWFCDEAACRAVCAYRARLTSVVGRFALQDRADLVACSITHFDDRDGMQRVWLSGRAIDHKLYLNHVAGFNLEVLMRALFGKGIPRKATNDTNAFVF